MEEKNMIPKIIHQIWIGEKLPPQDYLDSWKMSGFDYVLWNEEKLNQLDMINRNKYDYFYNEKIYYGAADIARVEILKQFGGLYIDADTLRLKDLPLEWFEYNFFAVKAHKNKKWNYRITNGVLGSVPNGDIINEYAYQISIAKKIFPCWNTIGGTTLTNIIQEKFIDNSDTLILEPWTFYPVSMKGKIEPQANDAYATHIWGSKTKKLYKLKSSL